MKLSSWIALVVFIVVTQLAGIIGSFFTISSVDTWYEGIAKPALNPPSWVFGPVWTTLFILMAVAAFLVWRKGISNKGVKVALGVYGIQLVLNTLWSIMFFGARNIGGALIEMAFLWIAIAVMLVLFYRISRPAAYLIIPYLLWVSFAFYLNYLIYALN